MILITILKLISYCHLQAERGKSRQSQTENWSGEVKVVFKTFKIEITKSI